MFFKKAASAVAIDDLVRELRYLQQPRNKTLTPAQLGDSLSKYIASIKQEDGCANADQAVLYADESAFLQMVEAEAAGRLSPMMERLARRTFSKFCHSALEDLADEAIETKR